MNWTHPLIATMAGFALLAPGDALAQAASEAKPPAQSEKSQGQATKPEKPEEKKDKTIDELTKDLAKLPGLFTFYRSKKGLTDTLYMEIPESQLGKLLLLQATASTGTAGTAAFVFHGAPLNDVPFRIRTVDGDRVLFLQPSLSARSPRDRETDRVLGRSYPENVIASFEVKARQPERNAVLIDVSDLFKSDPADVASGLDRSGYALDRQNTYIDNLTVLPENVVVRTVYRLNRKSPTSRGPRSFPLAVSYSVSSLPENGYQPRIADTRVGYFTESFEDVSNAANYDRNVNYILRWNVEKADPGAAMSPPKKPIVFWLDNGIPVKYRDAVREGLLMWNAAFERVGIKDAIVVKQMPDDADWDIADVRYNVIRWTVGMPFAIALFRSNPLTGEILNASINMDAVFASGAASSFDNIFNPIAPKQEGMEWLPERYRGRLCTYAAESAHHAEFGHEAMSLTATAAAPYSKEEMVKQYIREVVAHEMGHILGLRHNFAASTVATAKDLADGAFTAREGTTASVMDYMPVNIFAVRKKGVSFYSEVLGRYDLWAIEYGYKPIPGGSPEAELPVLRQIASRGNELGLAFQTDDMADDYDPYVYRFDMGREPLEYFTKTLQTSRHLLMTLGERKPKHGESYFEFTRSFNALTRSYLNSAAGATRFVGGLRVNSNFKGDPREKPTIIPVDAQTQRRALDLINRYLFAEKAFAFPKDYYAKLTGNPNAPGTQTDASDRLFPVFSTFSSAQRNALYNLFAPSRLTRIANNEFRVPNPSSTLTLADLFRETGGEIWSELRTGHEISQLRRQLQRDHLDLLINFVVARPDGVPDDAITLAQSQLASIRDAAKRAAPMARGAYGKPHLEEVVARIDGAFQAQTIRTP